jgi:threonine dehydratase
MLPAMSSPPAHVVSRSDVEAARARLRGVAAQTPVHTCAALAALAAPAGGPPPAVFFKCELFQTTGSFKYRGASNAVMLLAASGAGGAGVCTHSSGNHAAALAAAAQRAGVPCTVVMPSDAPAAKRAATAGYGATVVTCAPGGAARAAAAAAECARTGAAFVHPSEDARVMAGAGTLALELLEQAGPEPLDAIIVPVGGGGMISGVAAAVAGRCRVIGAEPAGADDAARSLAAGALLGHAPGAPDTAADGLRTTLGPHTWPVVRDLVERIVVVSEADIAAALRLVYERMKLAIEPSAAVGVAALLSEQVRALRLRRVGVVLCGGNADVEALGALFAAAAAQRAGGEGAAAAATTTTAAAERAH